MLPLISTALSARVIIRCGGLNCGKHLACRPSSTPPLLMTLNTPQSRRPALAVGLPPPAARSRPRRSPLPAIPWLPGEDLHLTLLAFVVFSAPRSASFGLPPAHEGVPFDPMPDQQAGNTQGQLANALRQGNDERCVRRQLKQRAEEDKAGLEGP